MNIDKWIQHHKGDEPLFGLDRSKGINRSISTEPLMTIEELEAELDIVTKQRDEVHAEVARLRGLLNENAYEHGLLVRRMIKAQDRRDEARAEVEHLTDERDEAKREAAESFKEMVMLYNDHSSTELEQQLRIEELTRERDEARAQLAAHDTGAPCDGHRHCCADRRKLAETLLRVRAERDALKELLRVRAKRDALKEKP